LSFGRVPAVTCFSILCQPSPCFFKRWPETPGTSFCGDSQPAILPNPFAELKGIYEHKDYGQRCSTAEMMMQEENITIPCIIDDMDNNVGVAYKALPDRLYVVREDGRLAIAAERGPRGLRPALEETWAWLAEYRETGNSRDSSKAQ